MDYVVIERKLLKLQKLCVINNSDNIDDVRKWIRWTQNKSIPNVSNPSAMITSWAHMLRTANLVYKSLERK